MIPVYEPLLGEEELKNVVEAVKSGWISSLGKFVLEFEEGFASYCGVKHGIAVSNGTTALHLALSSIGVGPGDEVIVPTLTFVATANAVRYTGADVVFADSETSTWNVDPKSIEQKITSKTKAIIVVHLYGHPVDMDPVLELGRKHGVYVIEDAAEAHGAEYNGKRVGGIGDIGCFSFYGNKIITTGEGGMLVTNDDMIAKRARLLRDHGMSPVKRYWFPEVGFNYRITNLQAAVGVAQLRKIEEIIRIKREIAAEYNHLLGGIEGIRLPPEEGWSKNVYWMYSILVESPYKISRDELMKELAESGIDSRPFFYPIHTMPPYFKGETYPVAERLSACGINLPSSPKLSKDDIRKVVGVIKRYG